jgi:6-phosphogluconolactonase (cycloisomerase 2 family)
MKHLKNIAAFALTLFSLVACQKETTILTPDTNAPGEVNVLQPDKNEEGEGLVGGTKHIYIMSNEVSSNVLLEYKRSSNGYLVFHTSYTTGGTGTGGGLGNQGAVIYTEDEEAVLNVNPGSNSISSFKVTGNGLLLKSTVASGGMRPVSIAQHDDIVYVLNAGGNGNISGFRLGNNKKLTPIPNSTRPLSSNASGAAEISFVRDGRVLVITEKATNKIITYTVNEYGIPGAMHSITSSSTTPFGFAPAVNGNVFVSEAVGGAPGASVLSSYHINSNGAISLINGSVGAGQSAACWVVITNNGKYAYTTNTASNNLTNFNVNTNTGSISVNTAIAATSQIGPIDADLSNNSKYLYVLNGGSHSISAYAVSNNGSLTNIQTVTGLPASANGLAAR